VLLAFERAERELDPDRRRTLLTFVIVGGGPTGVELAGALAEISRQSLARDFRHFDPAAANVILLEGGPSLLATFPEPLRDTARHDLEELGVQVETGAIVTNVQRDAVYVGERRIPAATILWAAGVAASPLGAALGAPTDRAGRVLVNPDLTVPGCSNVFVIGDLASLKGADGKPLPGVAQVAIQMGTHAARNIMRAIQHQPLQPFRYRDYGNLATIGRAKAVADLHWLRLRGLIGWLAWVFIHLVKLIGFRNRILVLVQWAWAYFSYERSVRLITGRSRDDPSQT
jgi:NADH dehydrogenase